MNTSLKKHSTLKGPERARVAAELRARYEAGESTADLAASAGRSHGSVVTLLHEAGTQMRERPGGSKPRGGGVRKTSRQAAPHETAQECAIDDCHDRSVVIIDVGGKVPLCQKHHIEVLLGYAKKLAAASTSMRTS